MNTTDINKARIEAYNKKHVHDTAFAITDEWDESKHPRAANGQFGSGGSKSASKSNQEFKRKLFKEAGERRAESASLLAKSRAGNATEAEQQRLNQLLSGSAAPQAAKPAKAKVTPTPAAKPAVKAKSTKLYYPDPRKAVNADIGDFRASLDNVKLIIGYIEKGADDWDYHTDLKEYLDEVVNDTNYNKYTPSEKRAIWKDCGGQENYNNIVKKAQELVGAKQKHR